MNHIISPEANAAATEYFGEAPANTKACALTTNPDHCDIFHADGRGRTSRRSTTGRRPRPSASTAGRTWSARTTPSGPQAWTEIKG